MKRFCSTTCLMCRSAISTPTGDGRIALCRAPLMHQRVLENDVSVSQLRCLTSNLRHGLKPLRRSGRNTTYRLLKRRLRSKAFGYLHIYSVQAINFRTSEACSTTLQIKLSIPTQITIDTPCRACHACHPVSSARLAPRNDSQVPMWYTLPLLPYPRANMFGLILDDRSVLVAV